MAEIPTIKYRNNNEWIDVLHPIGSFYFSTNSTSPADLFGGTWTQVIGAALRGASNTGYVGGDNIRLSVAQLPTHSHIAGTRVQWYDTASRPSLVLSGYYPNNDSNLCIDRTVLNTGNTGGGRRSVSSSTLTIATCGSELPSIFHLLGGDLDAAIAL